MPPEELRYPLCPFCFEFPNKLANVIEGWHEASVRYREATSITWRRQEE